MSESGGEKFEKSVYWKPSTPESFNIPLKEKEKLFYNSIDAFPKDAQELISSLSSSFLEKDVYEDFIGSKDNVNSLRKTLESQGLHSGQVRLVLDFFNLPYEETKK